MRRKYTVLRICCIFDNFPHFSITFLAALLPCCQCFHRTENWAPILRTSTLKDLIRFDSNKHVVLMMIYRVIFFNGPPLKSLSMENLGESTLT